MNLKNHEPQVFLNDDFRYLDWLSTHPDGWVLNVPTSVSGPVVQHQCKCWTIRGTRDWTGGAYYKVASEFRESLDRWFSTHRTGIVRQCGHCMGGKNEVAIARPHVKSMGQAQKKPRKVIQIDSAPAGWKLWSMGQPVHVMNGLEPRLASWDHREHPNQLRMNAYLEPVFEKLAPRLAGCGEWAINLIVDVGQEKHLHRGHDVENYITPLVKKLGPQHFVYAAVSKRVGGGSRISIGRAMRCSAEPPWRGWSGRVLSGLNSREGKLSIRGSLCNIVDAPLPSGPVTVHLAWRLSAARNWAELWKPTGDTMGPVLGEPKFPEKEFNPQDDRITELTLHRIVDDSLDAIDVGMWWDQPIP